MFESKNSSNENVVESLKTKKAKLNSEKRLNFSDSKILFNHINLDDDIIDIFLLYNGEIVKSLKSDSKNYYRIVSNQIGLSKEFQNLIVEIVNKIELTIQIKFSNNSSNNKGISFKSRLKMYNKKAENPNKQKDIKKKKNNKETKEENKEKLINNEIKEKAEKYKIKEENIITEEEYNNKNKDTDNDNLKKDKKGSDTNKEGFKKIRKKMSFLSKNEDQTFKMLLDYEEKIKKLESIINDKEEEIKKLANNKNHSENITKPIWNEIIKKDNLNNFMIFGKKYEDNKIVNILNERRKLYINKENEIEFIYNNNKTKTELKIENAYELYIYGKENIVEKNTLEIKKVTYEFSNVDKLFIEGNKKEENIIEKKDSIKIYGIKTTSSEICFLDKFTLMQNKNHIFINLNEEKNSTIQLLSTKKEKEPLSIHKLDKFNIESLIKPKLEKEKKDSLKLSSITKEPLKLFTIEKFYIHIVKSEDKNKNKNASDESFQPKLNILQTIHTNEIIIKNSNSSNIINKMQLVEQLEIQNNKIDSKRGTWITEKDKNNILIIEGIKKPLNVIISNDKICFSGKKNKEIESHYKNDIRNNQKKVFCLV